MRNANLGKKVSSETKEKISKSLKGRIFTPEHRKRKSLAQTGSKNHCYGKKFSEEVKKKMSNSQPKGANHKLSRKVLQISIETNQTIKIWDSMGDIRRELGIKHCTISDCCRGKQKTSGGFKWRYYE
jgi:group I intron endonuclease